MSAYTTRVGRSRRATAAVDLGALRYDERPDDGRQSAPLAYPDGWPVLPCPDCAERGKAHPVQWAEAGYVPGHRICPWCGSHWELTTTRAIGVEQGEPIRQTHEPSAWLLRRARFYR